MIFTAEQISRELAEIHSRIPLNLLKNVIREVQASPTVKHVVELALADPNFPAIKKRRLELLKAHGDLDKKKIVENPKIATMIDNFVGREINKKIKAGSLPPRSQIGNLPHVREVYERVLGKKK